MGQPYFHYVYKRMTLIEFEMYLNSLTDAQLAWFVGVTIHHTYNPTLPVWKKTVGGDKARMDSTANYYQYSVDNGRGWTAGPNLFITDEHVLQMTPVTMPGIHATICNTKYLGMEIVGDYDNQIWPPAVERMVYGALSTIFRRKRFAVNATTIKGHRDCNSPKTCPGAAISLDIVRRTLGGVMGNVPKPVEPAAGRHLVIGVGTQTATFAQWRKYLVDNGVTVRMVNDTELQRVYDLCVNLNVDAAFLSAVWKQEGFVDNPEDEFPNRPVIGGSTLQRESHMPINMKAASGEERMRVDYNGINWLAYSTWQLGLMAAVIHLKNEYAENRKLQYVEDIVPVLSGDKDGGKTYISNVLKRMSDMKALQP